ncbi:hypothetical protein E2C01_059879 [Portunus trituberculatus]|uniref:Uncharacterized protein n=1 Tax=Portunus trituberculatus TaxID=210409 RepID=A0A5B7HAI1_PORTR|nr:hypothetical protein [Portunus trituberculatus]
MQRSQQHARPQLSSKQYRPAAHPRVAQPPRVSPPMTPPGGRSTPAAAVHENTERSPSPSKGLASFTVPTANFCVSRARTAGHDCQTQLRKHTLDPSTLAQETKKS